MTTRFMPMEGLVRPFQTLQIAPLSFNLESPPQPGIVECKLGGSGGTTTTFTLEGFGFFTDNVSDFKESDRKSTKVKVENEDDPDQFVEFCRADKITLSAKKGSDAPAKGSSYDPGGGTNPGSRKKQNIEYQYPDEKSCKPKNPGKGGNC